MLAKRIIPVLLARDGNLVKGTQFDSRRVVGNALQAARVHAARGVDELIVLDVGATSAGRGPDIEWMRKLTEDCFIPVTVGGGVSKVDQVRELLANGADKVVIGVANAFDKELIRRCADKFGSQAVVAVINHMERESSYEARMLEWQGAGEILLNSVMRDGMMAGYDLDTIQTVASAVKIPVIACGGAGNYRHMHLALRRGADAVAAGAMFQWTDATPKGAAEYLSKKGWEVRLWK
jgi:imidazole glycerol-phosphate synthase subunit HisF